MARSGGSQLQEDLFGETDLEVCPESVLMALHAEYYELIWQRL
jgi:hypothetical protein